MMTILKRTDPPKRMDRWYMVAVLPSLFGPTTLVRAWGSRHTSYQRVRVEPMDDAKAAEAAAQIVAQKIKRGYVVVPDSEVR